MKSRSNTLCAGIALALLSTSLLVGCQKKNTPEESTQAAPPAQSEAAALADTMKKETAAMVAKTEKEAAATVAKAEEAMAKAKARADEDVAKAKAEAAGAKGAAEQMVASLQQPSAEMLAKYSSQIDALTTGVAVLKKVVDQNASLLPADVQAKYKELQMLVPQVTSLFNSLKGYQGADLTGIVSRLQSDLGSAQKLYGEIRGMLPPNLGGTVPKL